jgi:hypothetical protein
MARKDSTKTEPTSLAKNDAYTGMLIVSLLALLFGGVLLFLDYNQYPDKNPPKVAKVAPEAAIPPAGDQQAGENKKGEAGPKDAAKK